MPPKADSKSAVSLSPSHKAKLTGKFAHEWLPVEVEVQVVGSDLKLTVPGQPTYTLVAVTATRFRLTGPAEMPDGFYFNFELTDGTVTGATLDNRRRVPC
jgi:hypothetical protein